MSSNERLSFVFFSSFVVCYSGFLKYSGCVYGKVGVEVFVSFIYKPPCSSFLTRIFTSHQFSVRVFSPVVGEASFFLLFFIFFSTFCSLYFPLFFNWGNALYRISRDNLLSFEKKFFCQFFFFLHGLLCVVFVFSVILLYFIFILFFYIYIYKYFFFFVWVRVRRVHIKQIHWGWLKNLAKEKSTRYLFFYF